MISYKKLFGKEKISTKTLFWSVNIFLIDFCELDLFLN